MRASETILAGILSIAADAIIATDERQTITHFNQGAEQIFGWRADEVIGKSLDVLLPERFRTAHGAYIRHFGEGEDVARRMGHRREIFGLRKTGEAFPAEASIAKLDVAGGRVYAAVVRDVSERKRTEEGQRFLARAGAILASSLDYDVTLAAVPELAIGALGDWCALDVVEPDRAIRRAAVAWRDTRARGLCDAIGRSFADDRDASSPALDVLRAGRPLMIADMGDQGAVTDSIVDGEHTRRLRDLGVTSLLAMPLVAGHGAIGVLTCASLAPTRRFDAVDLSLAQDLAVRAALAIESARLYRTATRATRARDEVLGVVSHDLRNPLSAIAMCARVLRESPPESPDERRSLAAAIHESTEWMNRLIQDLLDVAAIEAGRLSLDRRREEVAPLVRRAVAMFEEAARGRSLVLRAEIAPHLRPVCGDADRILQVLVNLVGNAVKFTEPGGVVTIVAAMRGDDVVLTVTDTGPGIPPEHVQHLFELYWHVRRTARERGSGYGLAIAKGIVEAHGGRVWVESTPGVGSTFGFAMPSDHGRGAAGCGAVE
jgi:PAS domain S-box-containing protein